MISGINHLTLAIRDVDESFRFYHDILGFKPLAKWPKGAYFAAGDLWLALVHDPQLEATTRSDYTHVAFTVSSQDYTAMAQKIVDSGATVWQDNWTEGDSLYFSDPNGHKLEIHASDLATRLQTAKENPWDGLEFFD